MARPLRIQFENAFYHVTCRGNARQEIFTDDADRSSFLKLLERSLDIYQTEILAYVLMSNHFHLLVKTPLGNLQEFMRHFNICYTAYYNRKHDRPGHLYQGRYKSFLVDADHYLQEVSRYIHLNPVRVNLRSELTMDGKRKYLRNDRWSSYGGYVSTANRRPFLRAGEVLAHFGGDTVRGRKAYEEFVMEGLSTNTESPLERGKGHGILGVPEFIERMRGQYLPSFEESRELPAMKKILAQVEPERIVRGICDFFAVEKEALLKRGTKGVARIVLMEMLYRHGGMNQRQIGELLGLDYSSVSIARKRLFGTLEKDQKLLAKIRKLSQRLARSQE